MDRLRWEHTLQLNMKALGYIRVSTEKQAKEGISLEAQERQIRDYCKFKGFELVKIIRDAGVSGGKNRGRAGFVNLLNQIERNGFQALVLFSLERLSRDMLTLLALEKLLNEYGIQLHTAEGQISTGSPEGFMSFAMKSFLGEMERRQVRHRTKKVMQHLKDQGKVVGTIPYGFKRKGNSLVEHPKEQEIVRLIQGYYKKRKRLVDIVGLLKKEKYWDKGKKAVYPSAGKKDN